MRLKGQKMVRPDPLEVGRCCPRITNRELTPSYPVFTTNATNLQMRAQKHFEEGGSSIEQKIKSRGLEILAGLVKRTKYKTV